MEDNLTQDELNALTPKMWEMGIDLYVNLMTTDFEEPWHFVNPTFDDNSRRIAKAIMMSAASDGAPQRFSDTAFDEDYILSGFQCHASGRDHECGAIVWSDEDDPEHFKYLAATKGTSAAVRLPVRRVLPHLLKRARKGIPTTVLVLHNHPGNPLRDLVAEFIGMGPGPSGIDRDAWWTWQRLWLQSGLLVKPRFLLFESEGWREFKWPSGTAMLKLAAQIFGKGK